MRSEQESARVSVLNNLEARGLEEVNEGLRGIQEIVMSIYPMSDYQFGAQGKEQSQSGARKGYITQLKNSFCG